MEAAGDAIRLKLFSPPALNAFLRHLLLVLMAQLDGWMDGWKEGRSRSPPILAAQLRARLINIEP